MNNENDNARLYFPFSFLEQYDNENFGNVSLHDSNEHIMNNELPNTKKI